MKPISENAVICPHCAYDTLSVQHSPYLPKETILLGRYIVGKVISVTSDKATYIGLDKTLDRTVKIHEFLPQKLVVRKPDEENIIIKVKHEKLYYECMGSFETLWKKIAGLKNMAGIDEVYEVFFLNNTVYAVCEYEQCVTLRDYFASRQALLGWNKTCAAFKPVLYALSALHRQGIVHGNISPSTVSVGSDGKIRISSVSISQSYGETEQLTISPVDGYAPIERYKDQAVISPCSDIYSIMALMYTTATGIVPPAANARVKSDELVLPPQIERTMPEDAVRAFYSAMQVFPSARMKTLQELISAVSSNTNENVKKQHTVYAQTSPTVIKNNESQNTALQKPSEPQKNESDNESSTSAIVAKSFVTAIVVIVLIFVTLYSTLLYNYMRIEPLDKALSAISFLPMNINTVEPTTQEPHTTGELITAVETVAVADFTKLRYQDIKQNSVFNKNFDLVYEFEYSDDYEKNDVISQSIPFGETVNVGTTITLVISKGLPSVVLKDVIGMDYDDAYAVLTDDGFVVEKAVLDNDGAQTPNEVFTMSLVAGLEFEKGTQVTLSVWGKK